MDNIPPSMDSTDSAPLLQNLSTAATADIPPTIPRPVYMAPMYEYHGLAFESLPSDVMDWLRFYRIDNPATDYRPDLIEPLRRHLGEELTRSVAELCTRIVYTNIVYNILLTAYPPFTPPLRRLVAQLHGDLLPNLCTRIHANLRLADALVWVDVSARAGGPYALDTHAALQYRFLQTQPAIDQVIETLVGLYAWSVQMWKMGWRTDANGALFRLPPPHMDEVYAPCEHELSSEAPALPAEETPLRRPTPIPAPVERPHTPPHAISQSPPPPSYSPAPRIRSPRTSIIPRVFSPPPSPRAPQRRAQYNSLPRATVPPAWDDPDAWRPARMDID